MTCTVLSRIHRENGCVRRVLDEWIRFSDNPIMTMTNIATNILSSSMYQPLCHSLIFLDDKIKAYKFIFSKLSK